MTESIDSLLHVVDLYPEEMTMARYILYQFDHFDRFLLVLEDEYS